MERTIGARGKWASQQRLVICSRVPVCLEHVAVAEWADFMKARGITRVVGLLTAEEVETYAGAPPAATLASLERGARGGPRYAWEKVHEGKTVGLGLGVKRAARNPSRVAFGILKQLRYLYFLDVW